MSLAQMKVMSSIEHRRTAPREWLEERKAELLPVPYFHVAYTLPAPLADLAFINKAVLYDILF